MVDVILFSDVTQYLSNEIPAKNAGVHVLKTEILKLGYSCQVVDLFFHFTLEEIDSICKKFISEKTLIVGFSTTFWYDDSDILKLKKILKIISYTKKLNGPKIVFGGHSAARVSRKFLVHKVFTGFAEEDFINYLNNISGINKKYNFNFNDSQIIYSKDDFLNHGESTIIEVARGCIFKCSFCFFPLNGKNKFDYIKNKEILKDELIRNYENHGITIYTFSDDTFNDSTYKLEYLHNIFTSLPFKIRFTSYLRLDLLNAHREQINLLKEMGLFGTSFGVESFNYSAAKSIGKGMHPEKIKEFLYQLKSEYWKNDITVGVYLISGLPFETIKSHKETIDYILDKNYCLVDKIKSTTLHIPNPLVDKNPFKSMFQMNPEKFGFYWKNKNSNKWSNSLHEIKSQDQAEEMCDEINKTAKSQGKHNRENFIFPLYHNLSKFATNVKSFDEILKMNSQELDLWLKDNKKIMIDGYVKNYKSQILR